MRDVPGWEEVLLAGEFGQGWRILAGWHRLHCTDGRGFDQWLVGEPAIELFIGAWEVVAGGALQGQGYVGLVYGRERDWDEFLVLSLSVVEFLCDDVAFPRDAQA